MAPIQKQSSAAELLTPAGTNETETAFERALRDGTIPKFEEIDDPSTPQPPAPPTDVVQDKDDWASLIAFINANKDEGTEVVVVDPDTFTKGLQ